MFLRQTCRLRSNLALGVPLEGYDPDDLAPGRRDPQTAEKFMPFWNDLKSVIFSHFGMDDYLDQPKEGNLCATCSSSHLLPRPGSQFV
eukprot:SAG31_NODE_4518_length_3166_cov_1.642253_5_plen_88_part_00